MRQKRLNQLAQLAALRAEMSAAKLAKRQAVVLELERRSDALRQTPANASEDIAERMVMDRHNAWLRQELGKLSILLARAQADAQPYRETYARDLARSEVVKKLSNRR